MKKFLCLCILVITCLAFSEVYASNTFYDTRGTKYEGVVERMAKLNIINGVTETTFAPNKNVTRAELAKIIVKMKGMDVYAESMDYKKIFSDVKADDWFYPYVTIAADLGIINGYEDNSFKPNKEVTYAELVVILLRDLGYTRLSEDNPNGWYWNYIVKMREIELNDNIGEFDYTKPAKRGDVAMFAWNALITDRWAIVSESENDGFTYTYSEKTPLEMYFKGYNFIDNKYVSALYGIDGKPAVYVNGNAYPTSEKVPLYALGGNVTALYDTESEELIGVTFDEDYPDCKVISGPIFYLEEQGYNLSDARKVVSLGSKSNATYAYLVINNEKNEILRTVYLSTENNIIVDSISVKNESGESDDELIQKVELNEEEFTSRYSALIKDGYATDWSKLKEDQIVTDLNNGLYAYTNASVTEKITNINKKNEIWLDGEKYIILDNCICYLYNEKEAVKFSEISSNKIKNYIGTEATVYFNIAEEVCKIEFSKTEQDNEKYIIGYITDANFNEGLGEETIYVSYGENQKSKYKFDTSESYFELGELVSIVDDDENIKYTKIEKDVVFDNDISVKYNYDAKEIKYPMVGEYILTDTTEYYKVTLKYKNNSITEIEDCTIESMDLDEHNIDDLMAYQINLIYDENMEVLKVYAVNEVNKFENQIALVKEVRIIDADTDKPIYRVILSVTDSYRSSYQVEEEEFEKYASGDIITFIKTGSDKSEKIEFDECFKREFIGYKRDLVVKDFDVTEKKITFNDNSIMDLTKDIYDWNNNKINLNKYRFIFATVSKRDGEWNFYSLSMVDKEELKLKVGDRFAIGEMDNIIVVYRGYEE